MLLCVTGGPLQQQWVSHRTHASTRSSTCYGSGDDVSWCVRTCCLLIVALLLFASSALGQKPTDMAPLETSGGQCYKQYCIAALVALFLLFCLFLVNVVQSPERAAAHEDLLYLFYGMEEIVGSNVCIQRNRRKTTRRYSR